MSDVAVESSKVFQVLNLIKTPKYKLKLLGDAPTHSDLVDEMLDVIPVSQFQKQKTWVDPHCGRGTFLLKVIERLLEYHNETEIAKMIYGCDVDSYKVQTTKDLVAKRLNIDVEALNNNITVQHYTNWNPGMKFDNVVGNPPFQDSNKTEKGGSTLWSMFAKKSINDLVEDDGYVAYITPNAWLGFGKSGAAIKPYQLHKVFTDIEHYFPGVGSTFTAWILQKTPVYKETNFPDEGVKLDLRNYGKLPVGRPLAGLPVIEKVMNKQLPLLEPKIEKEFKGGWSAKQNTFINGCDAQLEKDKTYKYEVFHTNSLNYFVKDKPTDYNSPKIITSVTSPTPTLFTEPMGCANGDLRCYITVKDQLEGEQILSYLNSKLYRFVWRRPGMISWTSLAMPRLENKVWTDEELYEYFELTPEEIKIVETHKT